MDSYIAHFSVLTVDILQYTCSSYQHCTNYASVVSSSKTPQSTTSQKHVINSRFFIDLAVSCFLVYMGVLRNHGRQHSGSASRWLIRLKHPSYRGMTPRSKDGTVSSSLKSDGDISPLY